MKNYYIYLFLLTLFLCGRNENAIAQNLVPNPSFEDSLNCSGPWNGNCNLEIAHPWFNPSHGTPDYFSSYPFCGYSTVVGMQVPKSGSAYAGLYGQFVEFREYIEIPLLDSLLANHWYCIGFYISKSNFCSGAIDRIGAYLSNDSLLSTNAYHFAVTPQVESPQGILITDTTNWILVSGLYIAIGGEKFLTIGNFRDTTSTLFQNVDSANINCTHAYYLIDDVFVMDCDSLSSNPNTLNSTNNMMISIYQDNMKIKINNKLGRQGHLKILDMTGKLIQDYIIDSETETLIISKSQFKSQIYLVHYTDESVTYTKKILITN